MIRRTFTEEQIKTLSKNKNVRRCGAKSVRYTRSFKAEALRKYNEEGLSAVEIFKEAGFDLAVIDIRKPNKLMNQWNKAFGPRPVGQENTGITIKRIENRRVMKNLEAKMAYLQAENCFLAKFRAGKRK